MIKEKRHNMWRQEVTLVKRNAGKLLKTYVFEDLKPTLGNRKWNKIMHKGFVLLNCDLGAEEFIVEELKKISNVSQAYVTFGAYDVVAEINADSQENFDETVSLKIRRLTRVVSTMTLNIIDS